MTGEQKTGGMSVTPDLAGLCERLRETTLIPINPNRPKYGEKLRTQRNPDGPEAAAAIESLVAALKPFAREADAWPELADSDTLAMTAPDGTASAYDITMGDFRHARTALQGASDDR